MVIAESGAILEYLQDTYDSIGRFKPADAQGKQHYRFWLHYAEGSLMPLLLMRLLFTSLGKPPVPLGLRTLGGVIGKGAQKRTLIRSWKPMRALLTGIWQITPGLPESS